MRTLEFNVEKQRLNKKIGCDFSGLVAGTVGYLHAKFYFSNNEWKKCSARVARFWSGEQEYAMCLDENDSCVIPPEALKGSKFKVSVLGAAPGYRIETNKIGVRQEVT